ncbi:MAG: BolA/IbaG family iron-sulfur metabolism protein [Pseudomonadales bacterium]|nr:BolA/IbaG family iron-sulfur metabolism protein [Pseudomonadales bacterium]
MDASDIKTLIENGIENAEVHVQLDGNKCHAIVVSEAFDGVRSVKKQQMVYGCLNHLISSGELHAVTMQTHTPEEWEQQKKFGNPIA